MLRKRRIIAAAGRFAKRFGAHNLRRPWSFAVSSWRQQWYEANMNRLERLLHRKPAFRTGAKK